MEVKVVVTCLVGLFKHSYKKAWWTYSYHDQDRKYTFHRICKRLAITGAINIELGIVV